MKTPRPRTFLRLVLAAGFAFILGSARAADFISTWNGGNANWSLGSNWTTPGAAGTFPKNGAFTYDALLNSGVSTLTENITVKQLTLNGTIDINGPRTLSLDGLTGMGIIDNNGSTGGAAVTVEVGNNNTSSSFGGIIKNTVGSITLKKMGTGTLTLSGSNSFTGSTFILGGTLKTGANDALPATTNILFYQGSGDMTLDLNGFNNTVKQLWMSDAVGSTTTIETGAGTLTLSGSGNNILYGSGSGNGATINGNLKLGATSYESITFRILDDADAHDVTINATISSSQGARFFKDGAGTLLLTASNNTFGYDSTSALGGDAIIREGTLKLGANNVIPDGAGYGRVSFGTPAVAGARLDMAGFSDTINGLNSTSPATGIVDNSTGISTLTIGAGNTSSSYRGTIINSGGTLNIVKTGTNTLSYSQPGTLHSYTGTTTISGGTVNVTTLANGGSLSHLGASSSAASNLVFDGGGLAYFNLGFGGANAQSLDRLFTVTENGGTIVASGSTAFGSGALNFTNTGAYVSSGTGNRTLTIRGTNTGANTLAGVISDPTSGSMSVTKSNTGAWVLSGANTYGGTTTVSAGTLSATGSSGLGATTGELTVENTNTGAGTAVVLNLSTTAPTTKGSLSGTKATPSSGTNTMTINNGGQLLTINQTADATYAGTIAGNGGFTLGNLSTNALTLSGANTYSGTTTVDAGTLTGTGSTPFGATTGALAVNNTNTGAGTTVLLNLSTSAPTTKGSLSGTILTPSSGTNAATINNGGQVLTINQTADATFAGTITGNGGFTLGNLSTNTLTLSGVKSYTGATTVQAGTLQFTGGDGGSTTNGFSISNGATLRFGGSDFSLGATADVTGLGTVEFSAGTVTLAGSLSGSAINVNGGTASFGGTANATTANLSSGTLTGPATANASTFNWSGGTLSGTGGTTVAGGSITTTGAKGLDRTLNNTGTITFTGTSGAGGHIEFGVGNSTPGIINNSGIFNLSSGASFQTANANTSHAINNSGTWNVSGGGSNNTINTGIKFNNSGAVSVTGSSTFVTLGGGTQTGSFSVAGGSELWLTGGSNLNSGSSVTGAGKVTLGNTTINTGSTYNTTGETSLRGGSTILNTSATTGTLTGGTNQTQLTVSGATTKLKVNGAFTNNTQFTILQGGAIIETTAFNLNGGELKGNGSINGNVTTSGLSSVIAPGLSPGTLTINGNLALSSGNTLAMEIGGLSQGSLYDYLDVNGALTLAGMLDLNFINDFQTGVTSLDQFTLATANTDITGSFLNVASGGRLNVGSFGSFQVWYGAGSAFGASNLVLGDFTAVPEPSRAMLMLMGMCGLLMRRCRAGRGTPA